MLKTITKAAQAAAGFLSDVVGGGYDAVRDTKKRRIGSGVIRSEDNELNVTDRKKMLSSGQQLYRNFSLVRWMIARHLDYVSTFTFQAKCKSPELNAKLESLIRCWSRRDNFEASGRFSRAKFTRMAELQRTLNGDFGIIKLRNAKLQGLEGDRIRTPYGGLPDGWTPADFIHGVRTNEYGRHLAYSVCKRGKWSDAGGGGGRYEFERIIPARNLILFGYCDRFDQVRGVSPLASAMNSFADCYEAFDYALARMKISQIFGAVFTKQTVDENDPLDQVEEDEEGAEDTGEPKYGKIKWGGGPVQLDLDPGDDLKFVEAHNPSTEFQAFAQTIIQIALKALDIPYSFFAENYSNYSGARQALLQYEQAAKIKRQDLQELLDEITFWRVMLWIQDGELAGVAPDDIAWQWVPSGLPWIDPLKEVQAQLAALAAGLTSRQRILRETGDADFDNVVAELQYESDKLAGAGLPTGIAPANVQITEVAGK